jgi:NAD(P)-dependent dehydrogenase (short-subunit alcohol dehydrogenase family)
MRDPPDKISGRLTSSFSYRPHFVTTIPDPYTLFSIMPNILIVGGTRGLGAALVSLYAAQPSTTVYATSRSTTPPTDSALRNPDINWLSNIDLTKPTCGDDLASQLADISINTVIITAGIFKLEEFPNPNWDTQVATYTTSSIAPLFIVSALFKSNALPKSAPTPTKIVLVSSEAGSLTLAGAGGGGNYAHHASKSALNMAGLQLHYDLQPHGIAVYMVHPSFMRTEMTKGVGFDVAWEENDALTPAQAAELMEKWVAEQGMETSGQFWAPRGTRDIGSWKEVMGEHVKGPVRLPW